MKTPWHLWFIGLVALVAGGFFVYDFAASQLRIPAYMEHMQPAQQAFLERIPIWAHIVWGVMVVAMAIGALALLLRKPIAVALFGLSFCATVVMIFRNMVLANPSVFDMMGNAAFGFAGVMIAMTLGLWFYAGLMRARGVLAMSDEW